MALEIQDLYVSVEGKEILKGLTLTLQPGKVHALMGPNGAGKSTLSYALLGHPKYKITKGKILLDGKDVLQLPPDERAKLGLFLAFQYPTEIPGVNVFQFLLSLAKVKNPKRSPLEFKKQLSQYLETLGLPSNFAERQLNVGFSGGEKKRAEVLQMLVAQPSFAILDETDSGLDVDSLKTVAKAINALRGPGFGALVITHYPRILKHLKPDHVHVLIDGRIVKSGSHELVAEIDEKGYVPLGGVAANG